MVTELYRRLKDLNINIDMVNGELRLEAPRGTLTDGLLEEIRLHKSDLIDFINAYRNQAGKYQGIPVAGKATSYPLSSSQRRLWVLNQLDEKSLAYNMTRVLVFEGDLNVNALKSALLDLVERHEILRTVFRENEQGEVAQFIRTDAASSIHFACIDLQNDDMRESKLKQLVQEEITTPLDLAEGPLLRINLFSIAPGKWIFTYVMHHIISDGWSMDIVVRDLMALYDATIKGTGNSLPHLRIQYKDFAQWQQAQLSSDVLERHKEYWLDQFKGDLPVFGIPGSKTRPALKTFNGDIVYGSIPHELADKLRSLSAGQGSTLFMNLLAAVNVLLYKYCRQNDFIIGTPVAGREDEDLEDQIGFYVNTLALRTQVTGEETYYNLLNRVRQITLGAYSSQAYPFDELVEALNLKRDLSRNPLFDVMVILQNYSSDKAISVHYPGDLKITEYGDSEHVSSKLDILFKFNDTAAGIPYSIEFNTDIYTRESISRLSEHFGYLLQFIVTAPHIAIDRLEMISEEEKRKLVTEFNDPEACSDSAETLVSLIEARVRETPYDTALIAGNRSFTYTDLNDKANSLARYLIKNYGVGRDDLVAILLERSEWMIISMLAVLKSGAAYVPVDPSYPQARIDHILSDGKCKALIDDRELERYAECASGYDTGKPEAAAGPRDLAYVIYTSGSTGKPKGVMIEHRNVVSFLENFESRFFLHKGMSLAATTNYTFDISVLELIGSVIHGITLHLIPGDDPDEITKYILEKRIDVLQVTPSRLSHLLNADPALAAIGKLKVLLVGGEALRPSYYDQLKGLATSTINVYGPTETTIWSSGLHLGSSTALSIGNPLLNERIYITDRAFNLCPVGVTGEICIAGDGVGRGYLNDPSLTAEKFIADPFRSGQKMYRTGDLGRWLPDGNIEFIGRDNEQVKIRGYRIEPGEVENVLRTFPPVNDAAVVAIDIPGEGKELVAYIVSSVKIAVNEIRAYLKNYLPSYMLPSRYVQLEALPLTSNGKLDRKRLPEPSEQEISAGTEYVAPGSELEKKIAAVWEDILGRQGIGVNDNFFDLGGQSLKAARLLSRIHKSFDIKLGLKNIFTYPTIREQAQLIRESAATAFSKIQPAPPSDGYPLSSSQRRLWIISQFEEANIAYNIPGVYEFEGELNYPALEYAYHTLLERHESLRTVFRMDEGGEVKQYIKAAADAGFSIRYNDLRETADKHDKAKQIVQASFSQPFVLSSGPLLRVVVCQLDNNKWILSHVVHHIVSDGWSKDVLINELLLCYKAFAEKKPNPLKPLAIQYKDYAVWQGDQLSGKQLETYKNYWLKQFEGELPVLDLITDRIRPAVKTYNGRVESRKIDAAFGSGIRLLAKEQGASFYMSLLAAVNALLFRYTHQEDIIIGSPIAGRDHIDLERQVGVYANTLPLRIRFSGQDSFRELLERVKHVVLGAFDHQLYPFDELVNSLKLDRDMSRNPLFDVEVILQELDKASVESWQNLEGLKVSGYQTEEDAISSRFDLIFNFSALDGELQLNIEYNRDLFEHTTIIRVADHLVQMMESIVQNPSTPIQELDYLSEIEKEKLFLASRGPSDHLAGESTLVKLFDEQVLKTPGHPAVVFAGNTLSYRELDEKATRLAAYFRQTYSIQSGQLAGIMMDRSEMMIIAMLAILKSGAAYVPVDPAYPDNRKEFIFTDTGISLLITQTEYLFDLPFYTGNLFAIDVQLDTIDPSPLATAVPVGGNDLAYVIYTSGSTGRPKGVMIEHASIANTILAQIKAFGLKGGEKGLQFASTSFDASVSEIFCTIASGGTLYIVGDDIKKDPATFLHYITENGIELATLPPAYLQVLQVEQLGKIRKLITAGEAAVPDKALAFAASGEYFNAYGPTEASICATVYNLLPNTDILNGNVPVGKPISNVQVYILDSRDYPVPTGVAGEICISGAGIARGYWANPELTAGKFVPCPFNPAFKMYKTGDRGRWLASGDIEFLGRLDQQVKINGYRIEPGEIQNTLLNNPLIKLACVTVKEDGKGNKNLIAYWVSEADLTAAEIRDSLSAHLPAYMIPAYFVRLNELPVNSSGKVDLRALPDPAELMLDDLEYVAPGNETETQLIRIYEEVLDRSPIGITSNFFALGGDSIKAISLAVSIKKRLGIEVNIADIYEHETVEALAAHLPLISGTTGQYRELEEGLQEIEKIKEQIELEISETGKPLSGYEDIYPVTLVEQGMIYSSMLRVHEPVYYDQMMYAFRIENTGRFENVMQKLVQRHPILRSVYFMQTFSRPVKVVMKDISLPVSYEDISMLSGEERVKRLSDYVLEDQSFRLSFDGDLLWHMRAFRLSETEYCGVWNVHHSMLDGWSQSIFTSELSGLLLKGDDFPLPALRHSYRDYCAILLRRQSSAGIAAYWRSLLDGYTRNKLPFNYSGLTVSNNPGMRKVKGMMDGDVIRELNRICELHQVSFKAICLAAHTYLMHIICSENDVVTGTVTHDRPVIEDGEKIIGCFLNTIPVRVQFDKIGDVLSLLKHINEFLIQVKPQEIHLSEIAKVIEDKATAGNPIFDTILNFTDFRLYAGMDDVSGLPTESQLDMAKVADRNAMTNTLFDVEVDKTWDVLSVHIKYAPAYFNDADVRNALDLYIRILRFFARNTSSALSSFGLLTPDEESIMLNEFNGTEAPYSSEKTLSGVFEEQVLRTPGNAALVQDGITVTYQELNERANRLARHLVSLGIRPGDNVGLLASRSFEMIIGMYGILKAGGAYVPVDPEYPVDRQEYILANSGVRNVVTDALYPITEKTKQHDFIFINAPGISEYDSTDLGLVIDSRQLAYTIYTSGSTGRPKGVMIEHHSAINLIQWVNSEFNVGENDRLLFITSMCFDLSVYDIFGILAAGGTLVIVRQSEVQDVKKLKALLLEERITFWDSVPTTMNYLTAELEEESEIFRQNDLRLVFLSGDWIPVQLPARIRTFFPSVRVISLGGATEATVWSNFFPVEKAEPSWSSIPYGKPIRNNFFYILDDQLRHVPTGIVGELYIGGVGVARGYANDEEKTARAFVRDPFIGSLGGRMYRTGDIGRMMPDGNMEFLGRKDNQVKIRGFRVELGEIENVLLKNRHIKEAVVDVHKDSGNNNQLCAYLVLSGEMSTADIQSYLKEALPSYMVPSRYMVLDAIPLTSNGKINRKGLPAPEAFETLDKPARKATELEQTIISIWQKILGTERILPGDDVFELGAHSLNAAVFVNRIRSQMNVEMELRDVFSSPVIAEMASVIGNKIRKKYERILPVPVKDYYDLSSAQKRLWILCQFDQASVAYNIPMSFRIRGKLDKTVLRKALGAMAERHESLRTVFTLVNGEPKQKIIPAGEFELEVHELDGKGATQAVHQQMLSERTSRPFDLARGPLFHIQYLQVEENEHILCLTIHHIICDGWSISVFMNELLDSYKNLLKDPAYSLPPNLIQYKDYSDWQNRLLNSENNNRHREYWLGKFKDEVPVFELPVNKERPAYLDYKGRTIGFVLDEELSLKAKQFSSSKGVSMFMVLLSAVKALFYKYTGNGNIIVGTSFSGRNHVELENQLGFYINVLPLYTRINGQNNFDSILNAVKETIIGAHEHADYPFDQIVADLKLGKDLSRSPLFGVLVDFQNVEVELKETSLPEELDIENMKLAGEYSQYELAINFKQVGSRVAGYIEFNTSLYNQDYIEQFIEFYRNILGSLIDNNQVPVRDIDYISLPERKRLLIDFNDTQTAFDQENSLDRIFKQQAALHPDRTALVCGDAEYSYAMLDRYTDLLAGVILDNIHAVPDDVVGILLPRSEWGVIAMLAALKAGCAYVPIDIAHPWEMISYIIRDSGCKLLLTDERLKQQTEEKSPVRSLDIISLFNKENPDAVKHPLPQVHPDQLAYIIYTSGTTGKPKGVMIQHRGVVNMVKGMEQVIAHNSNLHYNIALTDSFNFDSGVQNMYTSLLLGHTLFVVSEDIRRDGFRLVDFYRYHSIQVTDCTPSLFSILLEAGIADSPLDLKHITIAGEVLPVKLVQRYYGNTGNHQVSITNIYGPTECSVNATAFSIDHANVNMLDAVPIGKPLPNYYIYILDKELRLLPAGVEGEIFIGGTGLSTGYINNKQLTEEKFIPDPFADGKLVYRTGDRGKWTPDGNIEFIGRNDDQVKIMGYRIELGEIEKNLVIHEDVSEAVVLTRNTGSQSELIAFVAGKGKLTTALLRDHLKRYLPGYMIPAQFVQVEQIPVTSNNKINKKSLLTLAENRNGERSDGIIAPRNTTEELIAEVWKEVLGLPAIGVKDNFFEIGGDSLKVIRAYNLMKDQLAGSIALADLFYYDTIEKLAQAMGNAAPVSDLNKEEEYSEIKI